MRRAKTWPLDGVADLGNQLSDAAQLSPVDRTEDSRQLAAAAL
jgi:hypothetical protein